MTDIRRMAGPVWAELDDRVVLEKLNAIGVLARLMHAVQTTGAPTGVQVSESDPEGRAASAEMPAATVKAKPNSGDRPSVWDHIPPDRRGGDIVIPDRSGYDDAELNHVFPA